MDPNFGNYPHVLAEACTSSRSTCLSSACSRSTFIRILGLRLESQGVRGLRAEDLGVETMGHQHGPLTLRFLYAYYVPYMYPYGSLESPPKSLLTLDKGLGYSLNSPKRVYMGDCIGKYFGTS